MDNEVFERPVNPVTCCAPTSGLHIAAEEANDFAAAFKAIGHPVRLQILDLLSRGEGQLCVCDVEECFTLAQPTISHHLRILREAGLVGVEQRGLWAYYFVQPARVDALRALLACWRGADNPDTGNR